MVSAGGSVVRLVAVTLCSCFLAACSNVPDMVYRPYPQQVPQHIGKIAIRPVANKTEVFGLEDKLSLALSDEFLRNGQYKITPENEADGVILTEIRRYIVTPTQYDVAMVPTVYKMDVLLRVQFYDKAANVILWEEPALQGTQIYSASTLSGGMTEDQARQVVWTLLTKNIVKRTIAGFGTVSSESEKRVGGNAPAPSVGTPISPVPGN